MKKLNIFNFLFLFMLLHIAQAQIPDQLKNKDLSKSRQYKQLQSETRINHNLLEIHDEFKSGVGVSRRVHTIMDNDYIQIEAFAKSPAEGQKLETELIEMGLKNPIRYKHIVNGMFPINNLRKTSEISSLFYVTHVIKPNLNIGSVDNQADQAMFSDLIKEQFGIDGTGKKIGVLSDSYNSLSGEALGVANGDLPGIGNPNGFTNPIEVLLDYSLPGSDEGRAMLELIHDIAPGADLAFHTAFEGLAAFASGIIGLRDAGCEIIVDDVINLCESMYQNGGVLIEAIDEVTNNGGDGGSLYFSSAGNQSNYSYESEYRESPNALPSGDVPFVFENGQIVQGFSLPPGSVAQFAFSWDEPGNLFTSNPQPYVNPVLSDIDIILFDSDFNQVGGSFIDNVGFQIACEVASVENLTDTVQDYFLLIVRYGPVPAVPNLIKYVEFGGRVTYLDMPELVNKGTCFGHANSPNAVAVGAARYDATPAFGVSPPVLEFFSSHGGVSLLFDGLGNRYPAPVVLEKPDIVAPQGTNNSFFGFDYEGDGSPNFFGTSASAPHVAALSALLCSRSLESRYNSSFSIQNIPGILKETAVEMDASGFDYRTGYGLVDGQAAYAAVLRQLAEIPTMGQWGLMILGLLILICSTVAIRERHDALTMSSK